MENRLNFRVKLKNNDFYDINIKDPIAMSDYAIWLNDDDIEYILSCTGLKDKNGDLIYEGDIVSFPVCIMDYQSSFPGMIDFYMNDVFYKDGVVVWEEDRYLIKLNRPHRFESGYEFNTQELCHQDDFIESLDNLMLSEKEKGYSEDECKGIFSDEDMYDKYKNRTLEYTVEIIGNIHEKKDKR